MALVRLIQKALGRRGFAVTHAMDGEHALTAIASKSFDVIALDHYLTTGTGLDFIRRFGEATGDAPPVVYVTGSTEINVGIAALKAGAADFVPKTVGDDFLVMLGSSLEQAVEKARLKQQKEAAEEEIRVARDRAELMLAEVNHRVANSLSLVSALVNLQAKAIDDPMAKAALAETQARIYAISLVHKRLYSSTDVRVVALDEYLSGLLDHLLAAMRSEGHSVSLTYALDQVTLNTDASVNLGVVVTEWVTNAFKYAYPSHQGAIRVRLRRLDDTKVELAVEDDGIGRNEDGSAHGTGLGTRIVSAMASSMRAEIEYRRRQPGTTARLIFSAETSAD